MGAGHDQAFLTVEQKTRDGLGHGQAVDGQTFDGLGLGDWSIWWAANLGAAGEQAVAGKVGDVLPAIEAARARAAAVDGWVMDVYLVRAPHPDREEGP